MRNEEFEPLSGATVLLTVTAPVGNHIGPVNRLHVSNKRGRFGWRATQVDYVTQDLEYAWANPGTAASVSKASSLRAGAALVRILDANGREVYNGLLAENGTFRTSPGVGGRWTVIVSLRRASGRFNFCLGGR